MSTSAATVLSPNDQLLASLCLAELAKMLKKHVDWQAACSAYSTLGLKTALDGRRPPSKDSKHRMYDQAYQLHRLLNLPDRPSSLADIDLLVRTARQILGVTA